MRVTHEYHHYTGSVQIRAKIYAKHRKLVFTGFPAEGKR